MKEEVNNLMLNLVKYMGYNNDFIILCLGSKKCNGDSLGCLVGSLLKYKYNIKLCCYGDYINNVNSKNIQFIYNLIKNTHKNKKVLVIDSAFAEDYELGNIKVHSYGLFPRSVIDYKFDCMGDFSITGIVGCKNLDLHSLFTINNNFIYNMAEIISLGIVKYLELSKYMNNLTY